jgi:gliding motility-associated-like protein
VKILIIILLFLPLYIKAQLSTSNQSAASLVQNVLLGPGVKVNNITFKGASQAIGQFNYNGNRLGLNKGIVITTGTVLNTGNGPQGPNKSEKSGVDNGSNGSPILNSLLSEGTTFNASILEFDFVPKGDTVSFRYIFGSEEYLEYVGKGFNDVFGLFISGPGINGNENIAKLPNHTVVSIDNVNNTSNKEYYIDNGNGRQSPFNSNSIYIQYDGYTRVLTAMSPVQCGQTYHLTIAIADAGDGILDSGIFLEAESLKSETNTNTKITLSEDLFDNKYTLAEGCTSAEIIFSRKETNLDLNVPVTVTGSASLGIDYSNTIPSNLHFPIGEDTLRFTINTLADDLNESDETIILNFNIPDPCSGTITNESYSLVIRNIDPLDFELKNDTIYCDENPNLTLVPKITGGLKPYNFIWSTTETLDSIVVAPIVTSNYSVTVNDYCRKTPVSKQIEVFIPPLIPININPLSDISELCPYMPYDIEPVVSGGYKKLFYQWRQNANLYDTSLNVTISPRQTGTYTLRVSDVCGTTSTTSFLYTVITPILIPKLNNPPNICPGDSVLLEASATLGYGDYSYRWKHSIDTLPNIWVKPLETKTYQVSISDECGTYAESELTHVTVFKPYANFAYYTSDLNFGKPIQFLDGSNDAISYQWDLGNGEFSTEKDPITIYNDIGQFDITLIIIDKNGCTDSVTKSILVGSVLYIPNTFTPNDDHLNEVLIVESYNVQIQSFEIFNRWGELIYESKNENRVNWDGTYKGENCQDGTYTYKVRYINPKNEMIEKLGHINLLR